MTDTSEKDEVTELIESFVGSAKEELEHRLQKWPIDFAKREVHEVVGALLARQVTLATQLAECVPIWNGHVAPLVLRAMVDAHISLSWILKDPVERCKKFIHYGLGQQKLMLEHRRADMESREPVEGEEEVCKAIEDWINTQRLTFLTDVNFGSWSGLSTRAMAEEAGCLDFYNYVYTPFSGCAHSMWQHIARYNLRSCDNPLHRPHGMPTTRVETPDPHYMYLGAEYLQMSFSEFDNAVGIKSDVESAFDVLSRKFEELGKKEADGKA